MRVKPILFIAVLCLFTLVLPASAADENDARFAVGYLYTPLASGLSLKIPIQNNFYLQPLLSVNIYESNGQTDGAYSLGLRGIAGFTATKDLYPYVGLGYGHTRSFHGSGLLESGTDEQRQGFSAFFGMEYRRHLIRPAVEVGIMNLYRSDGSYHIGTTINVGAYYYL